MKLQVTGTIKYLWLMAGGVLIVASLAGEGLAKAGLGIWGIFSVLLGLRWLFSKDWVPKLVDFVRRGFFFGLIGVGAAIGFVALTQASASPSDHQTLTLALQTMGRQGSVFPNEKNAGLAFVRESLCLTTQATKVCQLPKESEDLVGPMFEALLAKDTALFDSRWSAAVNAYATDRLAQAEKKAATLIERAQKIDKIEPVSPWAMVALAVAIALGGAWYAMWAGPLWGKLAGMAMGIAATIVVFDLWLPAEARPHSLLMTGFLIAIAVELIAVPIEILGLIKGSFTPRNPRLAVSWATLTTALTAALSVPILGFLQLPIMSDAVINSHGGITFNEAYITFNVGFLAGLALLSFLQGLIPKVLSRIL